MSYPLIVAAYDNELETIRKLLADGADPNVIDENHLTPLIWATSFRGSIEAVNELLKYGANPNMVGSFNRSPLFIGCFWQNLDKVKVLLLNGADPSISDGYGQSPLYMASQHGNFEMVEELLFYGADPKSSIRAFPGLFDEINRDKYPEVFNLIQDYFPTFRSLCVRCIIRHKINVSRVPPVLLEK